MEDKILNNAEDLTQGTEKLISENTDAINNTEVKESAAELMMRKLAERKNSQEGNSTDEIQVEKTVIETEKVIKAEEKMAEMPDLNASAKLVEEIHGANDDESEAEYHAKTREELVSIFRDLIENTPINEIKNKADKIKSVFYTKLNNEVAELREKFIEEGHAKEEFPKTEDEIEKAFRALYSVFREKRAEVSIKLEKEKENNLKAKYQIIEDIKNLLNKPEAFNHTFNDFKELQKRWREIGLVPQSEVKALWENYNLHVENFYNYININNELRDLDLKKNLEIKLDLCQKAEALLLETAVVKAFRELQQLHDTWREIGPVPNEKKDELWERFKSATIHINKKHQDHFEELKAEQEKNLSAKQAICEKAEEIVNSVFENHQQWKERAENVIELQKMWKGIGYAPKKYNQDVYDRFRKACDSFFNKKREFYAGENEEKENNLQRKTDLCVRAESLKDSNEWQKTADIFKNLQEEWKKIGPVQRKHSDEIWKRFRKACNHFFDKKNEFFKSRGSEEETNLQLKKDLIEEIKNFEFTENTSADLDKLKEFQNRWSAIGFVPFEEKDKIYKEYREIVNAKFDKLNAGRANKNEVRFKERIESIRNSNKSKDLMNDEIDKVRHKIDTIKSEINLWENNLGFFANTKNAVSMINDFKNKIEKSKETVKELQKQVEMMLKSEPEKE